MTANRKPTDEAAATFVRRHIGPSPRDVSAMLESVGAKSLDALMAETLPSSIRQKVPLDLGPPLSETESLKHMRELASRNEVFTSLIGQGYSGTILPAVIQRNILENPAWYTAYTPYQPEISQGRLEALFNFQTMICDLTGLDVANASLLDEATAAAEAMALAERAASAKTNKTKSFFVDSEVHPQTLAVLRTRAEPLGWNLVVGDPLADLGRAEVFGALLQYPGTSGAVRDFRPVIDRVHRGDHRQQHLRGAEVGGRLFAADVLLAGLQRQPIGRRPARIHGQPDDAAGQRSLQRIAHRHIGRVRAAIAHRHTKTLRRSDCDIGAEFAGRGY